MSRWRFLARRTAGLVVSVWAVLTLTFAYLELTPRVDTAPGGGGQSTGARSVAIPISRDGSVFERYVDWLTWLASVPDPVVDPVVEASGYTVAYLLPAMVVAVLLGTVVRVYSVGTRGRLLDRSVDALALVAVSVPAFAIAFLFERYLLVDYVSLLGRVGAYRSTQGPFTWRNLTAAVWPWLAMTTYLLAIQLHHAGEHLRNYADEQFVKTARAKGLGDWRVGWHLFRNTAVTLAFVQVTNMYGMLLVGLFTVEYVVGLPGIGGLIISAVSRSNLPLLLGLTILFVSLGALTTFLQDLAYALTDPRVDFEE